MIGSADAFNSGGRAHSCYWLEDAGVAPLMVDFGATALARLKALEIDPRALGGVLVTHLHGDHIGGLPFLILDGLYNLFRTSPLALVGPVGLRARIGDLLASTYGDATLLDAFPHTIQEILPGESASLFGVVVEAFAALHMDPPERPLCLRVTGGDGKKVAFSGDTEICDGLFAAAAGTDLLIAECTRLEPPAGRHITWQEWQASFERVTAKKLVLSHLDDGVRARIPELLRQAPRHLDLEFAEDGQLFVL